MEFSKDDLAVYAYMKHLRETRAVKFGSEAEALLRRKFEHVNMTNSYTYVMRYFRYREKIEAALEAENSRTDSENDAADPACEDST